MKRILCLMLCALMAVFACACGDGDIKPTEIKTEATEAPTETVTETATADTVAPTESSSKEILKEFIHSFDTAPVVEDKLVYDKSDLSVTLHSIDYSAASGPQLKMTLENNFDKDVIVQADYAVVNGYMITPEMSVEVSKGKSAEGTMTLPYYNLAIANITSIQQLEYSLRVVEPENYNPIETTDPISVDTSAVDEEKEECDESGQVAYDKKGVKIVLRDFNPDRTYSDDAELIVYMCNNTDKNIAVQTKTVTVNGYEMTSTMNCSILSGMKAVDAVTIYALDLEEYDIESIDSLSVSFVIKDADTWKNIATTDTIHVEIKQEETVAATDDSTTADK